MIRILRYKRQNVGMTELEAVMPPVPSVKYDDEIDGAFEEAQKTLGNLIEVYLTERRKIANKRNNINS